MKEVVIKSIQMIASIWEMWLCYRVVYLTILDKRHISKAERIFVWSNIIILGVLLGINRFASFFSSVMFCFCVLATSLCLWLVKRKKLLLIIGIVVLYFAIVALLDFVFAFMSMEFLVYDFTSGVYIRAISYWNGMIFICSRTIVSICIWGILKRTGAFYNEIEDYQGIIIGVGVALCIILIRYQILLDSMVKGLKEMQGRSNVFSLLVIAAIIALCGVFIVKYQFIKKEKEVLQLRDKMMERQYQEMMLSQEIVHDMKNHFIILKEYENQQNWAKLSDYLGEISEVIINLSIKQWTGNKLLDMIFSHKELEAEHQNIKINIQTVQLEKVPFSDSEIIALFGNLLDNAIEACERIKEGDRWIDIEIRKQNQLIFIEISNSISTLPINRNGEFITVKKERVQHGYGLKSVQRIVNKYEGNIRYQIKQNSFFISITFFDNVEDKRKGRG